MVALRSRVRPGVVVAAVLVVALAVFVVLVVRTPRPSCKGIGIASALDGRGHPSEEAAVDEYVRSAMSLTTEPVPLDGWHRDGRHWVRDLPNGSRYRLTVRETNGGWVVGGDWEICAAS